MTCYFTLYLPTLAGVSLVLSWQYRVKRAMDFQHLFLPFPGARFSLSFSTCLSSSLLLVLAGLGICLMVQWSNGPASLEPSAFSDR